MLGFGSRFVAFGSVLAVLVFAPSAHAQQKPRKSPPACGIRYLPLAVGSVFTYGYVQGSQSRRENEPPLPPELVIEVLKVEPAEKDGKRIPGSKVTLSERYRGVTKQTEIFCSGSGFSVDPQSFFFTGEAGGGLNMDLVDVNRTSDDPSWPAQLKTGATWREDINAKVVRRPTAGSSLAAIPEAKIEIERIAKVEGSETITVGDSEHKGSQKVLLKLTGRAFGENEKSVSIVGKDSMGRDAPEAEARFWFKNDVGLVRVENRYHQIWELLPAPAAATTPTPAAAPTPTPPTPAPAQ
jgi:hypothetical protein